MEHKTDHQANYVRTRDGYQHLVGMLSSSLPPMPGATPEALHRRMQDAISRIASLCPVNAVEAGMGVQHVTADARASECMRLADEPGCDIGQKLRCVAQAGAMMRQSQSALRALERLQAIREKRDGKAETAEAAAWAEHIALSAMLGTVSDAADAVHAPPAADPPPLVAAEIIPPPAPEAGEMSEADLYEVIYPQRAALIRRHGGVPADVSFGPPDEEIVRALLSSRPPPLRQVA